MKAYWIRSDAQVIQEVTYKTLADLQRMTGGPMEAGHHFKRDVILVDGQAPIKRPSYFFIIRGGQHTLAGNGVVVGRRRSRGEELIVTIDPRITLEEVTSVIRFCTMAEINHAPGYA